MDQSWMGIVWTSALQSANLITTHTLHVGSPEHTMETLDDNLWSF